MGTFQPPQQASFISNQTCDVAHWHLASFCCGTDLSVIGDKKPADLTRRANHPASLVFELWRVNPHPQKYFCFSETKIELYDLPSRPGRGASAIVTNVGTGSGGRGRARAQG
jgi:hypothetical protein